jgi:hypothetical protein
MSHSLLSANRTAHVKIVVVALAAAVLFVTVGMNVRATFVQTSGSGAIVKAGDRSSFAERDGVKIRK